jgi:hypothetical protein
MEHETDGIDWQGSVNQTRVTSPYLNLLVAAVECVAWLAGRSHVMELETGPLKRFGVDRKSNKVIYTLPYTQRYWHVSFL